MTFILHLSHPSTRRQQRLRGDAAAVDAGASDVVSGKDGSGEGLGAGVEGGSVASYAAADDDDVVVVGAAFGCFQRRSGGGAQPGCLLRGEGNGCREDGGGEQESHFRAVFMLLTLCIEWWSRCA
eukprot:scaffold1771_cov211-Alexandrium_tamarense.AAC.7